MICDLHTTVKTREAARRATRSWLYPILGVVLLALSVVAWGLHDKLSLYTPPHATPVSAKAKLLSQRERATEALPEALDASKDPSLQPDGLRVALVAATLMLACFAPGSLRLRPYFPPRFKPARPIFQPSGNAALRPPPIA